MNTRLFFRIFFLGIACVVGQEVIAGEEHSPLNLPDVARTATSNQLKEMKRLLEEVRSGRVSYAAIMKKQTLAAHFNGARDDEGEVGLLGRLFTSEKNRLRAEEERDEAKRNLRNMSNRPKIALGCLGLFIVIDKILLPVAKRCYKYLRKDTTPKKKPPFGERLVAAFKGGHKA